MELLHRIEHYWTQRAEGYSAVNQEELAGEQKRKWLAVLQKYLPKGEPSQIRVLDVGTGPGFFAIILAEAGYQVTAVDYTEEMLTKARENAGPVSGRICWRRMDAANLSFADESFDAIVSRNVTWNLEMPDQAYAHWYRVLKKGGRLLNFDANWYAHLYDKEKRAQYEEDRRRVEDLAMEDHYTCTDIDEMEEIARRVPLSRIARPAWDERMLRALGCRCITIRNSIWKQVWSDVEKVNYASTPMFLVVGEKQER